MFLALPSLPFFAANLGVVMGIIISSKLLVHVEFSDSFLSHLLPSLPLIPRVLLDPVKVKLSSPSA